MGKLNDSLFALEWKLPLATVNRDRLRERYKQLVPGHAINAPRFKREDLSTILKLALNHKEPTEENILICKMEAYLESVPEIYRPFATAIYKLYVESRA